MFGVVLLTSAFVMLAGAHIYERCELARELLKLGVNRDHVATWVCIAFHESRFDTAARNWHSGDHGLLQISELYWCGPGKACGVPCSAFRNEDISDDVQCALRIYDEHTRLQGDGFLAWVVYPQHCKHNAKKYLVDCDMSVKTQTKFEDRSRYLKSLERNDTVPPYVTYPNINQWKPNYLSVSELIKNSYDSQYEQNYYRNEAPFKWLNFKINNIDKLIFPNFNSNRNHEFTKPSTTTTIDQSLKGIKPPAPRRIESNQFRRRNSLSWPTKDDVRNDYISRKFKEATTRSTPYTEIDLSHNLFINLHKLRTSKTSTETPYQTREISSYNPSYIKNFSSTTPRTFINSVSVSTKYNRSDYMPRKSFIDPLTNESVMEIDLSHNLFINLHKLRTSKTSTPYRTKELSNYNPSYSRGFTMTTARTNTNLISISTRDNEKSVLVPRKSLVEGSSSNEVSTEIDLSHNPFINLHKLTTKIPFQTRESSSYLPSYINRFTSATPRTTTRITTKSLKPYEKTVSTEIQSYNSYTMTPNTIVPRRGKSRYMPENNNNYIRTNSPSTRSTNISVSNIKVLVNSSKQNEQQKTEFREKTYQASNITFQENTGKVVGIDEAKTAPLAGSSSDITQKFVTTPKPLAASTTSGTTRSPRFHWNKTHDIQSTTLKSQTTSSTSPASTTRTKMASTWTTTYRTPTTRTNTQSPISTHKSVSSTQATPVTQNATKSAPTMKNTWSIFDLYLNPTTASIKPFKFTPFESSYKLSIFSDGTTMSPYLASKKQKR
ncbi:unnamed protein product [Euphydryas editha]|uniref:Lysozyme n=1 Tax=Euphydryas editha TaxID=104508 RepID=A0AAU9UUM5_EUPED|nr:unnamed protein product [Euphydryas editha]